MNGWVNNGEAGDLRCHRAHYDVTLMCMPQGSTGDQLPSSLCGLLVRDVNLPRDFEIGEIEA